MTDDTSYGQSPEEIEEAQRIERHQARLMSELVETEAWKVYVSILRGMQDMRTQIIKTPLYMLGEDFDRLDSVGRAMAMESVKGTLIGLRLAETLPNDMIDATKQTANSEESDL